MKIQVVNNAQKLQFTDPRHQLHIYNGLDSLTTCDLYQRLQPLQKSASLTVEYEHKMIGPILDMTLRGILVDEEARQQTLSKLSTDLNNCEFALNYLMEAVWPSRTTHFNPNSPTQVVELFNKKLFLPKSASLSVKKGAVKESFDRDTLEDIAANYIRCKPFCDLILAIRDCQKKIEVLKKPLDENNRFKYSFNVAGTDTYRLSSSNDPFGYGQNIQNITPALRHIFIPDRGFTLCYLDLQGAEARVVAYMTGDPNYINTVESSDSHTGVAKMVWPNLPWTGDPAADRAVADQLYYRDKSYRDLSKRFAHGSNYYGKPPTLAKETKTKRALAEEFQSRYFKAFPGIYEWQMKTKRELNQHGCLVNPFGMKRTFWNRLEDDATLRAAIAFLPQSTIGVIMNVGIHKIWSTLSQEDVQLLANIHDAILLQIRTSELDNILPVVLDLLHVPFSITDINGTSRNLTIAVDCEVGGNWGHYNTDPSKGPVNLHGLKRM